MDATSRGTSYVYGIERHTLCLASLAGDTANNRFALGTLGITEPGEIHLVDFKSDENILQSTVYKHSSGVRALASTPWDPSRLVVVNCGSPSAKTTQPMVELVALPDLPHHALSDQEPAAEHETQRVAQLQPAGTQITDPLHQAPPSPHSVVCHPTAHGKRAAVVSAANVVIWNLAQSPEPSSIFTVTASTQLMDDIEAAAWHPTNANQFSTTDSTCIRTWDTRTDAQKTHETMTIECAHSAKVRALDYNPNLPYILASGGDDGSVRIWDTRNPTTALMEMDNHTHWVYGVEFNPNHDQLLLSAGSDGLVNLESAVSVSSAHVVAGIGSRSASNTSRSYPSNSLDIAAAAATETNNDKGTTKNSDNSDDEDDTQKPTDGLVAQFDDHETSVYAAHWSAADPWIFASLSFDGRMVINLVPREEKYKILL
ncbi:Protein tssc1 [Coemansia sp. RSA 1813]|nr:Protein tssc1 [Coemansia sp. RSA 1646]KAJ1771739.1 Protein tssc1 [Coemansia sp. RSA 1843]KAJ2091695.1 Protein tssc1 [Coemansia sp. RSA 986]KAJ2216902.1 Protein tssc1 [Coemansia sp. RSA 487]KAJ2571906.1 Protein tssc1 [Coemansia sp. RSA 1813]